MRNLDFDATWATEVINDVEAEGNYLASDAMLDIFESQVNKENPLFAQDHNKAKAYKIESPNKAQPPKKRHRPGAEKRAPWSRFANGKSLKKPSHGKALVGWKEPCRKVGDDIGAPLVFSRSQVVGRRRNR